MTWCGALPDGAVVEASVLFDGVSVGAGAEVRRAVLDKGVRLAPGTRVGFDPDADRRRGFVVSEAGVTCVPKGTVVGPPEELIPPAGRPPPAELNQTI